MSKLSAKSTPHGEAHPYGDDRAFENWKAARNKALRELDMEFARAAMPDATNDEVRLTALHKARYECVEIEAELRYQSRNWLQERGYKRLHNLAWMPGKELPE